MSLSKKKCADILKDEAQAAKEYDKLGFHQQAKDELNHYKFFKKKCRKH